MIVLNTILVLSGVAAVASIANLFKVGNKSKSVTPMKVKLPGGMPIISLSSERGDVMNFIIDSGSNISHICPEYVDSISAKITGTYEEGCISGLGAVNTGITMCNATLYNLFSYSKYNVNLSISEPFSSVAEDIEKNTGVKIHGLLGTDFLREYNYVINFKSLEIYPEK